MANNTEGWRLDRRQRTWAGEVAYGVFGEGPPVVLIHGTPSRSYIWRKVAPTLAGRFSVYVFDLLGYGDSRPSGDDISIAAQARALAELLEQWELDSPAVAGHDIGGAIALRAHLLESVRFDRMALLDAVVLRSWITEASRHVQAHMNAYHTMPTHIYEQMVAAHLRTTVNHPMDEDAFEAYMNQWRGESGQKDYLQKVAQFDEKLTEEFEPLLGSVRVPVKIIWGEQDAWLDPAIARRLHELLPTSAGPTLIPEAGHFVMEDAPEEVARELLGFFAGERSPQQAEESI
ncbi:MAG: alpha/beta hydrolase [Actinomycetota bacterium]|nr:alpha/beta hydrolase [Actinomycetota bacterium]